MGTTITELQLRYTTQPTGTDFGAAALDRTELTKRLACAANDEAQQLLREAERLELVLHASRLRRQSAWLVK
jgi:hypothetical protein